MNKKIAAIVIGILCISTVASVIYQGKAENSNSAYISELTRLTTNQYRDWQPVWSKDGSKILYFAYDNDWDRHLWTMNSDGTNKTQLTFGNVIDETGDYSPDGTKIVFIRYAIDRGLDGFDLWTMNSDGSNMQRLTSTGLHHQHPKWSHDGQRLAFFYGGAGTTVGELHIMDVDGKNEVTVVSSSYQGMTLSWSYDDKAIAYTANDGIWLVNTSPPYSKTHLYQTTLPCISVAFSPDGKYLLYSSGIWAEPQDLFLLDSNGNYTAQLTNDTNLGYPFDWSPDGKYIAFSSLKSGNADIWRAQITLPDQSPTTLWMQWYFWTNILLALTTIGFAFTTIHYRAKTSTPKQTTTVQSKSISTETRVCPNCGTILPANSKFCGKCGASLD